MTKGPARRAPTRALACGSAAKPKPKTESSEQIRFVGRVKHFYPDVLIFAVPNGGRRSPMEASRLKEEGVLAGASDLVVLEPRGGWFGLLIEMKRTNGGVLSDAQADFLKRARSKGYRCVVALGCEEAWEAFEAYLRLPETWVSD